MVFLRRACFSGGLRGGGWSADGPWRLHQRRDATNVAISPLLGPPDLLPHLVVNLIVKAPTPVAAHPLPESAELTTLFQGFHHHVERQAELMP